MTQNNSLNVKLSNSQLNKLKYAIKNENTVALRLLSNMVVNSDNVTNFPHKLLVTNRQVANLLLTTYQLMLSYQKLNCLRLYYQMDFLVNFLIH